MWSVERGFKDCRNDMVAKDREYSKHRLGPVVCYKRMNVVSQLLQNRMLETLDDSKDHNNLPDILS